MKKRIAFSILSTLAVLSLVTLPAEGRGGQRGRPPRAGQQGARGPQQGRAPESQMRARGADASTQRAQRKSTSELVEQNARLTSRLKELLPEGTEPQAAAAGFRNLGEFVSAVHVSRNLGIPFEYLKARTTGPDAVSLGKAIKELKPGVDPGAEVKKARKQAKRDLKEAGA